MSKHKHHNKNVYEEGKSSFGVENLGSVLGNFDLSSIMNLLSNVDINKVLEIIANISSKANTNINTNGGNNNGSNDMVSSLLKVFNSSMGTGVNKDNNQYNEMEQEDLVNDSENNFEDFRELISKFSDYYSNSSNEEEDGFTLENNIIDPVEATTESIDMSINMSADDDNIINLLNAIQRLATEEDIEKIQIIKNNLQNIE
ncbi:hypothetical protein [Clostridium sp. DL1XJH146]